MTEAAPRRTDLDTAAETGLAEVNGGHRSLWTDVW